MNYQTISETFEANAAARARLKAVVEGLSDAQVSFRPDENTWTVSEIVEHIAIVERGITSLISRLLEQSSEENIPNDGSANISEKFQRLSSGISEPGSPKLEAPERVRPTGQKSIAESLAVLQENADKLEKLRGGLESTSTQNRQFPHPFFGDMSATEWLALLGGHESRHVNQIEEVLSQQK